MAVGSRLATPRRRFLTSRRREALAGIIFAGPWLIGFFGLIFFPLLQSLWYSLTSYDVLHPARFVGLDNYRSLFGDNLAQQSFGNTLYMAGIGVPIGIVVALIMALLLNQEVRGISLYRTIFYIPSITPVVAASLLWLWLLNGNNGLINSALAEANINGPDWFNDIAWAKPAVIVMITWGSAGSTMIILLAGLKNIPQSLYEAAQIDGASIFAQFRTITIPMLSPTLFFVLVIAVINTFQIFTQAYITTQGGPLNSTLFYVYYLFDNAFGYFKMGYASAMAWMLFLVILALTLIQFRLARYWVFYE
jgi:multiple sugar transport system permease protein